MEADADGVGVVVEESGLLHDDLHVVQLDFNIDVEPALLTTATRALLKPYEALVPVVLCGWFSDDTVLLSRAKKRMNDDRDRY